MSYLTNAEKAAARVAARAAAKAEAELSWSEGWRLPTKSQVSKRMGKCHTYLNRSWLSEVAEVEFAVVIEQQCKAIVAEAEAMLAELKGGRLNGVIGFTELERRLKCKRTLLATAAVEPDHRFHKARQQCLDIWGKDWRRAGSTAAPAIPEKKPSTEPEPPMRLQRFCRCCNTVALGKETINGYLPECWAEYQRLVAIDEGRLSRLSA